MSPRITKVVTINLFSDLSRWDDRRTLLAEGLADLGADLVAVQEVSLPENNASWLAEQIGLEHVYLTPKTGREKENEGIYPSDHFGLAAKISLKEHPGRRDEVAVTRSHEFSR
jgi:mRNA deadenylase 3'-5' endonuclease subunit Ccr4